MRATAVLPLVLLAGIAGCKKKAPEVVAPVDRPGTVESTLQVVSVSPSTVAPNAAASVSVFGSGFDGSTRVRFGDTPASAVTFDSGNQLRVGVPPLAVGEYDVTVEGATDADTLSRGLRVGTVNAGGTACEYVVLYFETDHSDLTDAARSTLGGLVDCYLGTEDPVRIAGHADERGTTDYNLALSYRRALAVQAYLVTLGIPKTRLPVASFGEEQPSERGGGELVWAKNRRVELTLD
ncbi:MAG: OmpA family protein [Myxococcota bacterium]